MPTPAASLRVPYLAYASSRLLLLATAYLALALFPVRTIEPWMTEAFGGNPWIDGWVRWDAFWYESIVDGANQFLPPGHSNANFFPFYACVSWLVALPLQPFLEYSKAFYVAGLVVSHVSFLFALIGVFRVAETLANRDVAERSIWLLAFFPFSFYFAAVYADALYFCLSVWAFRNAQLERWHVAAVLSVAATLTRITGFVLIAGLVVDFLWRSSADRRSIRRGVTPAAILLFAPVILFTYFLVRYGDPLAFLHARQTAWLRAAGIGSLLTDIDYYTDGTLLSCGNVRECLRGWDFTRQLLGLWYLTLVPAGVGLALAAWRVIGPGMVIWVIGTYAMALVNGLDGMGRFTAVLFPIFIALAIRIRSRAVIATVCALWLPFLLLFLGGFVRWRAVL